MPWKEENPFDINLGAEYTTIQVYSPNRKTAPDSQRMPEQQEPAKSKTYKSEPAEKELQ